MRKTGFIMGFIAGTINIIVVISYLVLEMSVYFDDPPAMVFMILYLIASCFLLRCICNIKHSERASTGIWTLILSVACGFIPCVTLVNTFMIGAEKIFYSIFGLLCMLITIAVGIMALASHKKPPVYQEGDSCALVRSGKNGMNITAVVFAFIGGLISAVFSIIDFIDFADIIEDYNYMAILDLFPSVFMLVLLLIGLVGAVVLLFNRLQGGVLLVLSGGFALLMMLISSSLVDIDVVVVLLIIGALLTLVAGIIGISGFAEQNKRTAKNAVQPSI